MEGSVSSAADTGGKLRGTRCIPGPEKRDFLYLANETYEDGEYLYICISDTGNGFSKEALDAIENDTPIIYHGRHHVGISI